MTWNEGLRRLHEDAMDGARVVLVVDGAFVEEAVPSVDPFVGALNDAAFVDEADNG